jgi:hypothetical protein
MESIMRRTTLFVGCFLITIATGSTGCSDRGAAQSGVLGAPSSLVAAPLGGGVHLTWNDNSVDEELFEIERQEQGTTFAKLDAVPFDTAVYHDANVTLGIAYSYRVRAKLAAGFSSYSNTATLTLGSSGVGGAASAGGAASGGEGQIVTAGTAGANPNGGSNASGGQGTAGRGGSGGGGAAGSPGGGSTTGGTGAVQVSFKADIAPALVKSCGSTTAGCHNADQAVGRIMPQFGPCKVIWYSAVDAPVGAKYTSGPNQGQPTGCTDLGLYDRLLGLHSMLCDAPSWDKRARYVVPGDLENSLIYQVIAGDASMGGMCKTMDGPVRKMPLVDPKILPNGVELGDSEIAKIRAWILEGAKNN